MKSIPIPGAPRWCIYLGSPEIDGTKKVANGEPNGLVGHICEGFSSSYAVMVAFDLGKDGKMYWKKMKCYDCGSTIPEDVKAMVEFCR